MPEQADRTSGTLRKTGSLSTEGSFSQADPHPAGHLTVHAAMVSDVGRAREHQEDTAAFFTPPDATVLAQRGYLLVVADGMGGHNAGEIASQAAVGELERVYYRGSGDDLASGLNQAVHAANQAVYKLAQADARHQGMGTTVAAAVVHARDLWVANVGDSRIYLVRGGQITQITHDHSWVEEQVRAGVLTPEQARIHPQRNIITRAIGTSATVEADYFTSTLQEGDILVLCSDGLTGHLADPEILEIVGQSAPDQAARRLIDLANERGGLDNLTVIVARLEPAGTLAPAAASVVPPAPPARRSPVVWMAILAGVILGLLIVVFLVLRQPPVGTVAPTPTGGAAVAVAASPTLSVTAPAVVPATISVSIGISNGRPVTLTLVLPQGTITPTATLRPTATAAPPTATSTPTAVVTRVSSPAASTAIAAGVAALQEPDDNTDIREDQLVTFVWAWSGPLPADQAFEVRLWQDGQADHLGAATPIQQPTNGRWQQTIRVSDTPGVRDGGEGTYWWTVGLVRRATGARIGNEASPRRFVYRTGSGGPPPTNTPRPPTDTPQPPTETPEPTSTPR
jgi:serine/threonine protein phosphatase PrpC